MSNVKYKSTGIEVNGRFIKLSDIITECNNIKISENDLVILNLEWPSTRSFDGAWEMLAVSRDTAAEIENIISGKTIYFGEIAGKHSDIYGTLENSEITIIDDEIQVAKFISDNPSKRAYNHSFLDQFHTYATEGQYEDLTEEDAYNFRKLYSHE